jgi:type IV secretion system protein VirB9
LQLRSAQSAAPPQPTPVVPNAPAPTPLNWPPGQPGAHAAPIAPSLAAPSDVRRVPAIDLSSAPSDASAGGATTAAEPKHVGPPPPVNLLSGNDSTLTSRESANVATAKRWVDGPRDVSRDLASQGTNGTVVFRFGATMPSIVCAPLYVCDIALQPGETVTTIQAGDSVRWKVTPATSGSEPMLITHAVIKPTDIGLTTNLLITTDRRTYSLKLVSRKDDYMPSVSFSYPEDEAAQWAAIAQRHLEQRAATVIPETGQNVAALDFGYRVTGATPLWRPQRVYSDGIKTYIQFPKAMQADEAPALVAIGADKKEQMVNYRLSGNAYVVDKVLDRAMLVSGAGRRCG